MRTELGIDVAQENYIDGIDPNNASVIAGRLLVGFTYSFNENVSFEENAEVYENVLDPADLRVLNNAAVSVHTVYMDIMKVG